jgi:hypothetical protein
LNQAIQGDDYYYLKGAQYAQTNPAHPHHAEYVFLGSKVSMRGHPHPPGNGWVLAGILALTNDVREPVYHAVYLAFSVIAAVSALSIARRFTARPVLATLLFLAVPAFVVNGNSLESDLPLLAFWLLTVALYLSARAIAAALAAAVASMFAFQALLLTPILFFAPGRRRWLPIVTPVVAFAGFQLFERLTSGALPASVLAGYMQSYGWQRVEMKLRNAAALMGHLAVLIVCPMVWLDRPRRADRFLLWWIALFFAGALAIFFAGSARYLLPLALPVCILASESRFAKPALAVQAVLAMAMAAVNYQHWDGYRQIQPPAARRVFVNGEWGLRHYLEAQGAIPLEKGQTFRAGDVIVSTAYAPRVPAATALVREVEIQSPVPVRMVGLGVNTAYSTVDLGWWPVEFSRKPLDRVRIETIIDREPRLSVVRFDQPEAAEHVVQGIFPDRWTLQEGTLVLKPLSGPAVLRAAFYLPANAVPRRVTMLLDGAVAGEVECPRDGVYQLEARVPAMTASKATVTLRTDRTLQLPTDQRALGVLLTEAGFYPMN